MQDNLIAISTNDYKNVASDVFGQSHFFVICEINQETLTKIETRENVLFMRSCDLQGRAEHLHGLLGDVKYFIGTRYNPHAREYLNGKGHQLIEIEPQTIEDIVSRFPLETLKRMQNLAEKE